MTKKKQKQNQSKIFLVQKRLCLSALRKNLFSIFVVSAKVEAVISVGVLD